MDSILLEKSFKESGLSTFKYRNALFHFKSVNFKNLPTIEKKSISIDGTVKFLIKLNDGLFIETVLIPFHKKYSICLSTQVGCSLGCKFCLTGIKGFKRDLKAFEIVAQYLLVKEWLFTNTDNIAPPNIVLMGEGEPLLNFEQVKKSIEVFLDKDGIYLGPRQITLSTAGIVNKLSRLAELKGINIAFSLHSANQAIRDSIMPISKNNKLCDILGELKKHPLQKKQFITLEYILIDEINNSQKDAELLSEFASSLSSIINIIPFNPYPKTNFKRPSPQSIELFKQLLIKKNMRVMVRRTKGNDIQASCGQLKGELLNET